MWVHVTPGWTVCLLSVSVKTWCMQRIQSSNLFRSSKERYASTMSTRSLTIQTVCGSLQVKDIGHRYRTIHAAFRRHCDISQPIHGDLLKILRMKWFFAISHILHHKIPFCLFEIWNISRTNLPMIHYSFEFPPQSLLLGEWWAMHAPLLTTIRAGDNAVLEASG